MNARLEKHASRMREIALGKHSVTCRQCGEQFFTAKMLKAHLSASDCGRLEAAEKAKKR